MGSIINVELRIIISQHMILILNYVMLSGYQEVLLNLDGDTFLEQKAFIM